MSILVTGATGFIGRALVEALKARGEALRLLVRPGSDAAGLEGPGVTICRGALEDPAAAYQAMKGCRRVYHLGALVAPWARDPSEFDRVNVDGTRHVLEAAAAEGIERVVYTSTVMILGPTFGHVADETATWRVPFFTDYARTKARAQEIVDRCATQGMNVVAVLPSLVYGPGLRGLEHSAGAFLTRMAKGTRFPFPGSGQGRVSLAYIDDIVRGHLLAMEKGRKGERYVLGGVNVTVRDVVSLVASMRGKPIRFVPIPLGLARMMATLEELKGRLIGGKVRITRSGIEAYTHDWAYTSEKAIRELGYTITPLREGLAKTMRWLQSARTSAV